jgi:Phosphotransferase enzyme family
MNTLVDALQTALGDPEDVTLAQAICGTGHPDQIAQHIEQFCLQHLGTTVEACLLLTFSVGAACGLLLADGRRVLLKLHPPERSLQELSAVAAVQAQLATDGFPCPPVLQSPRVWGRGVVTVDAYLDVGQQDDAHDPTIRTAMAETLAELIARTQQYARPPGLALGAVPQDRLWPPPHNALFDFSRATAEAVWIDTIAQRAQATLGTVGFRHDVVGHLDWSVKNMRFTDTRVCMVYDWDSLRVEDECIIVGSAAVHFPVTWDLPVVLTPTPEECLAFVYAYEGARGRPFSRDQHRRIRAAGTYAIAYTARCEHALDPIGARVAGSFRDILAQAANLDYIPLS